MRLLTTIILYSIVLGLIGPNASAQTPPVWRYWTAEDGLQNSYTIDIVMCKDGSLFANPANSFLDGYTVNSLPLDRSKNENFFQVHVEEDSEGNLWAIRVFVGENQEDDQEAGFMKYNRKTNQWSLFPVSDFKNLGWVYGLYFSITEKNRFIYTLPDQVREFNPESGASKTIVSATIASLGDFGKQVINSASGGVWVQAASGVLRVKHKSNNTENGYECISYPIADDLDDYELIFELIEKENGVLYGSSYFEKPDSKKRWDLICLKDGQWEITAKNIFQGWKDSRTRLWTISSKGKINIHNNDVIHKIDGHYIYGSFVLDIEFGNDDSVFLGTMDGIIRYAPPLWDAPDFLPTDSHKSIWGMGSDSSGLQWLVNGSNLISIENETIHSFTYQHNIPENMYCTPSDKIFEFADNRLVVGMVKTLINGNYGLLFFDKNTETFDIIVHPTREILACYSHNENALLVVTKDKTKDKHFLEIYNCKDFQIITDSSVVPRLDNKHRTDILSSANGDIWFGYRGKQGPGLFRNGAYRTFGKEDGYLDNFPVQIIEIANGNILIGGEDSVYEYDGKNWTELIPCAEMVRGLIAGGDGDIWAACANGFYRYRDGSYTLMDYQYGVPSSRILNLTEDGLGRIWVSTMSNGISLFQPNADRDAPQTFISPQENIKSFSPDSDVRFVCSGIDKWKYTRKEHLKYSHRFDDGDWSPFIFNTVITKEGLAPGPHQLQVRAMDVNWNQDQMPAEWEFSIELQLYQEPLVMVIISFSSLLIFVFAGYAINRHFRLREANKNLNLFNSELQDANAQLIQLDQMKTQFVSQASHDLRTPLTAIKGSLDNLLMGIAGALSEKQTKIMTRATTSVDRLTNLINDVLDLNRIETGRIVLEKTDIPFKALVENIINENRPASDQKQIQLAFVASDGDCILHIDGSKIERVVGELISNAIKYTPDKGTVDVCLSFEDDTASLSVKDSGIGMTPEECGKIWERFYRTNASKKFAKGSGLGLSIAKELVELHGGALAVEREQGNGTRFSLLLPVEGKKNE